MPTKTTEPRQISTASAYRQRRNAGTEWEAPSGAVIRVRELDLSDHAVIGSFPSELQQMIYKAIEASATLRGKPSEDIDDDANPFAGLSGDEVLAREYEIGTKLVKLGWIEPQVVDVVEDEDIQISVDEVDSRDRREYMLRTFGVSGGEAKQFATFPEQPAGSVGSRPTLSTLRPNALGPDEA
ncbi:MAG: hypothetical protein ACR2OE_09510 [Thermomicrobiales bacterium]